ncbi:NUDIX domain-containing protein [Pseudoleptotrichia goodfellowii]|uniref:Hydrolase, NUDIX family n=1 Tax=Pseudoleptotrichia goodfellowii F0264 TaxID=596323 RepID=D0GMJ3_9FUSO|nr:NUDIX domain-containing protein [Pseudoleptotrichia goodfellowii]EEY34688.1 hydrolase, NUDIX family [Pseudoleptotrichia goodfellowii F0264]
MEKIRPRVRVAGILIENERILLIEHSKNDKKYWLVPGGGVDWGESTAESLIREYKEETNLDIEVESFLFLSETIAPDKEKHVINLYFKVKRKDTSKEDLKLGNEEMLTDLKFFEKEKIKNIKLYPNIKEQIIKLLNKEEIVPYLGLLWDK